MKFPIRRLPIALLILVTFTTITSGCGQKSPEAPAKVGAAVAPTQAEPQQMDAIGAANAANALLEFKPAGCKTPSDSFVAWACSQTSLVKLVSEVNKQRDAVSQKLEGKMDIDMFSEDTMAFSSKLASCLQSASQRSACVTQAFTAHSKQMAAYGEQQGGGAVATATPSVGTQSPAKTFGAWQPDDYKSMTLANYLSMQLKQLDESKAYWNKRLPELVITSNCSAKSSDKGLNDEDRKMIAQGQKTCDASLFRTAFTDGDKIKRARTDIHHVAIAGGCVDAVRWLVEQCIPGSFTGESWKPPKPSDWGADLIGIKADDDKKWAEMNPKFKGTLDSLAVYRANAPDGWKWTMSFSPLNEAATSGQPDAVRYVLATGVPIDARSNQTPLATAIANFRGNGCNQSETIKTEHCAGRLEVIKVMVALGAALDMEDRSYNTPLEQAKKDGAKPVVDFLTWAGAKEPAPKAPEKPLDPVVGRCLEQVNRTLNTTTGGSAVGLQMEVQRQAQAMQECYALADGKRPERDGALASVALQAEYARFADQVAGGRHPNCKFISGDIKTLLLRGEVNSHRVIELIETAKQHGCVQ